MSSCFIDKVVLASSGEEVLFTDINPESEMDIKVIFVKRPIEITLL